MPTYQGNDLMRLNPLRVAEDAESHHRSDGVKDHRFPAGRYLRRQLSREARYVAD